MQQPPEQARWLDGIVYPIAKRQDYTNALLTKLIELQGGAPPTPPDWIGELITTLNKLALAIEKLTIPVVSNRETFITGEKTVTTAGEAVQLTTSSIPIPNGFQLTIIAKPGNTGTIYIGNREEEAEGGSKFDGLSPGLAASLRITNVNLVWVNGDTDGDGVSWYVER